ncbi:cytochrome P450 [Obba rivulosa]|uniref:Cytochrome P450 n=1 Tax=Obba rivulosa TaxID=1052685 RepID=A0A8E2DST8_9APHY|nr:cytochrome P450 [Obba rivulosa]
MELSSFTLAVLTALILVAARIAVRKHRSNLPLPPGPVRRPVLGNLFDVPTTSPWLKYLQMSDECGSDIICLKVFGTHIIVTNTLKATINLLERRSLSYSGRPHMTMLNDLMGIKWSLPMMDYSDEWKGGRKMFQHELGSDSVRKYRHVELHEAHRLLGRLLDRPESFVDHIRYLAGATIISIAYGIKVKPHDDPFIKIGEVALHVIASAADAGTYLVDVLPILKHIPDWLPGAKFKRDAVRFRKWTDALLNEPFDVVKESMARGELSDCAAASLYDNFCKDAPDPSSMERVLKSTLGSMFVGGADTTVSTLGTFFLAMVLHPEVQVRAQKEMDAVVGTGRLPNFSDQRSLPYITAILKECLRWNPGLALNFPHCSTSDDVYEGYYIPKGSIVISNLWAILHDEDVYTEPSAFNPDRFMRDTQLNPDLLDPASVAFGFGRRICPGRFMALESMWIVIACVLATFTISKAVDRDGREITPDAEYLPGFLRHSKPFPCTIRPRSKQQEDLISQLTDL